MPAYIKKKKEGDAATKGDELGVQDRKFENKYVCYLFVCPTVRGSSKRGKRGKRNALEEYSNNTLQ